MESRDIDNIRFNKQGKWVRGIRSRISFILKIGSLSCQRIWRPCNSGCILCSSDIHDDGHGLSVSIFVNISVAQLAMVSKHWATHYNKKYKKIIKKML